MKARVISAAVVELILILMGIAAFITDGLANLMILAVWELVAISYLLVRFLALRAYRHDSDQAAPATNVPPRTTHLGFWTSFVGAIVASVVGLTAAGQILLGEETVALIKEEIPVAFGTDFVEDIRETVWEPTALLGTLVAFVAGLAVIAAWMILHLGFAARYAMVQERLNPRPGLMFPSTPHPNQLDFTYFSFTVGTSFAVSDVETASRSMRLAVLQHGVVSFFFNTAILGIAIGALTGK